MNFHDINHSRGGWKGQFVRDLTLAVCSSLSDALATAGRQPCVLPGFAGGPMGPRSSGDCCRSPWPSLARPQIQSRRSADVTGAARYQTCAMQRCGFDARSYLRGSWCSGSRCSLIETPSRATTKWSSNLTRPLHSTNPHSSPRLNLMDESCRST